MIATLEVQTEIENANRVLDKLENALKQIEAYASENGIKYNTIVEKRNAEKGRIVKASFRVEQTKSYFRGFIVETMNIYNFKFTDTIEKGNEVTHVFTQKLW
jgi:dihydroorotase